MRFNEVENESCHGFLIMKSSFFIQKVGWKTSLFTDDVVGTMSSGNFVNLELGDGE